MQIGQDGLADCGDPDRVWLQDDGFGAQRDNFAQRQSRADAGCFGFRGAKLDNFPFARRAAEDERTAIPGRVAQNFHTKRELRDPDAGDPYVGPRLTAHNPIIERLF